MLEHYKSENSEYEDLFYGWDVVNEAVSDVSGTYRNDTESPNWAKVYGSQSNEYIINAFKYANKYASPKWELYYNDYNDSDPNKSTGIANLIKAVKAAEGTRIDAVGMQAHHKLKQGPSVSQIEVAVRKYAEAGVKIQLTEFDLTADGTYDGTAATRDDAYAKQAQRYREIYNVIKKLDREEGIDISGITMWGVIDKNSWLHSSSSVGGGANGVDKQCPLLFDDNYKAKPAFWAFVDASLLEPAISQVKLVQRVDDTYSQGIEYSFAQGNTSASFIPMWDASGLKILVNVQDATVDVTDAVTVYVDPAMVKGNVTPVKVTVNRADATAIDGGYQAVISVPLSTVGVSTKLGLDVLVVNGTEKAAFNDTKYTQDTNSKYYAEAIMKPYMSIAKADAAITIDGVADAAWNEVTAVPLTINNGSEVEANVKLLWDATNLYVYADITDANLDAAESAATHEQDSLEVFIDENNGKTASYEADDKQYRINYQNVPSFNGTKCLQENLVSATKTTSTGYVVEAAYKWTDITPVANTEIGLELQINDAKNGTRIGTLSWYDESGQGWSTTEVYGTAMLASDEPTPTTPPTSGGNSGSSSAPSATATPAPSATPAPQATVTPVPSETEAPEEEPVAPSMPEVVEDVVSNLATLLGGNSTFAERLEAAAEIINTVRDLAREGQLLDFTREAIEYTEELICEALGKQLQVDQKDEDVPQISKVTGAILSVAADKEAKLTVETVKEDKAPKMPKGYENGYAMDIKLWEDDTPIQPSVPVTIRMKLPKGIDGKRNVKVLHYSDGVEEPEVLDTAIFDDEFEFTTTGFSTFVVVNVATGEVVPEIDEGAAEEVVTGESNASQPEKEVVEEASSITPIIIVVVVIVVIALAIGVFIAIRSKKDDIVD